MRNIIKERKEQKGEFHPIMPSFVYQEIIVCSTMPEVGYRHSKIHVKQKYCHLCIYLLVSLRCHYRPLSFRLLRC